METIVSICGCGKSLIAVYDKDGNMMGVTHATFEDEDYHSQYFAGLIPVEAPKKDTDN